MWKDLKIMKDNFMDFPVLSEKWQMDGNLRACTSQDSEFSDCCATGFSQCIPFPNSLHKTDIFLINIPSLLLFQGYPCHS